MKKYLEIKEKLADISNYDFEASFDKVILMLQELKETNEAKGYTNLTLSVEYTAFSDDGSYFELRGTRKETDRERNKRLAKAKKEIEQRKKDIDKEEDAEHSLYLKLKRKFES